MKLVPRDRFLVYYRMVDETRAFQERVRTADSVQRWTAEAIRAAAPRPERVLPYLAAMTEGLIHARQSGRNVESDFFGA